MSGFVAILYVGLMLSTSSRVHADNRKFDPLCEKHITVAAKAENVPMGLLYAVALTETGVAGRLSPYALNIEGKSMIAKTLSDALVHFNAARHDGKTLIDVGCMQINYRYHHRAFGEVEDLFDPELNVKYAASLLATLKRRHGTWTNAVARYHAGPKNRVAQRRYACKVLHNLVATGFGRWTHESRLFCSVNAK